MVAIMLHRLTYYSTRSPTCGNLRNLVAHAAERNRGRGYTGLLIADAHYFLQVLEGSAAGLANLYQRIALDPRHSDVVQVQVEEIAEPSYPDWGMAQVYDVGRIMTLYWGAADKVFDPSTMSPRQISDFLRLASFEMLNARAAG
jgi:Sensors of blue-light using FAD